MNERIRKRMGVKSTPAQREPVFGGAAYEWKTCPECGVQLSTSTMGQLAHMRHKHKLSGVDAAKRLGIYVDNVVKRNEGT